MTSQPINSATDPRPARGGRWAVAAALVGALAWAMPAAAQQGEGPHAPGHDVEAPEGAGGHGEGHEGGGAAGGGGGHGAMNWWPFVIVQTVGFGCLLVVAGKFAWPAIRGGLDGRAARVGKAFADAEREEREVERLVTEHRDRLHGFAVEAGRRRDAALREAAALRAQTEADAREQAAALREKAAREVELERARARLEVRREVIERAFAEAERQLRARADDRFDDALVGRYIGDLGSLPPLL